MKTSLLYVALFMMWFLGFCAGMMVAPSCSQADNYRYEPYSRYDKHGPTYSETRVYGYHEAYRQPLSTLYINEMLHEAARSNRRSEERRAARSEALDRKMVDEVFDYLESRKP